MSFRELASQRSQARPMVGLIDASALAASSGERYLGAAPRLSACIWRRAFTSV